MCWLNIGRNLQIAGLSAAELFDISETDTVWEAWLTTINLLDLLEYTHELGDNSYDFADARNKISRIYSVAEKHSIDKPDICCTCGLSSAEHAILKRKILTFFRLQVCNLKHLSIDH